MRKKYMGLFIIGILLIVTLGTIGCSKKDNSTIKKPVEKNMNDQDTQKTDDAESLYESTLSEVQKINDNSDMLGAVLLSKPDKEVPLETPTFLPLDKEGNKGYYYVSIYHDESVITQITLESPDVNVLGIHVGDDKQVIADKLKDTAYELSDPVPEYQIVYEAYHVTLSFKLSESGKIVSILVYVYDPTEVIPTL
ncbi:MAG TPA: hypothetical protein VHP81_03300 [Lachnospiraceae bacterium]|nr:hypothetical protein [Lachnospiraceae bacterium]